MSWEHLAIAGGGACGALLRFAVGGWVQSSQLTAQVRGLAPTFPWGTVLVNLSGCLAIGLLAGLFYRSWMAPPLVRSFLLIGLLGGYTTFSTFALETLRLLETGSYGLALANGLGSPALGLLGVWLGDLATRTAAS